MDNVWTGERLETFIVNATAVEHLHRYALARSICENLDVLDIASGEGYGSHLLSQAARQVTGVDISENAVLNASAKYKQPNLTFKVGSASEIPLEDNSIDTVVSFETIEHHDQHEKMLEEIKRVLKPGGKLLISSPDKKYYSDVPKYNNPFHVKELYFEEFKDLISSKFKNSSFFFQKIVSGSLIIPENTVDGFKEYTGSYDELSEQHYAPLYNMCLASDDELPLMCGTSLFNGKDIIDKENQEILSNTVDNAVINAERSIRNTWSYRIGRVLTSPARLIKGS